MNYFFLLLFLPLSLTAEIIIVYGPSCAGKSSLSKALVNELGENWKLLDRDNIELELVDEKATDERLMEELVAALQHGKNVIVELQDPTHLQDMFKETSAFTIFVYAPLQYLLKRDEERTIRRNRSRNQQYRARSFVINTYADLLSLEPTGSLVETISPQDIPEEIFSYYLYDDSHAFFQSIIGSNRQLSLYANNRYDMIVNSHRDTIEQSLEKILQLLKVL